MYIFPTVDKAEQTVFMSVASLSNTGSCLPDPRAAKTIQVHNEHISKFSMFILAFLKRQLVSVQMPEISFKKDLIKSSASDFHFTFTSEFGFLMSAAGYTVDKISSTAFLLDSWAGKWL